MIEQTFIYTEDHIESIAHLLVQECNSAAIITFTGPLGAGKTTLVRAFLRALGVVETITSPTYTYVNIYKNNKEKVFYHFDLYRINSVDDFIQAGFYEYLYTPQGVVLIEWPHVITSLYRDRVVHVTIEYTDDPETRRMRITQDFEQEAPPA